MELGTDEGVVAVSFNENSTGKTFADTKVRYTWELAIDGKMHTIEFTNTKTSGKKRVFVDGRLLHEMTVIRSRNFQYSWPIGGHLLSIVPIQAEGSDSMLDKVMDRVASSVDCPFELRINGLPFRSFRKRSVVPVHRPTRPLPVSQGYVTAPATAIRPATRPSPEQQADREYEEMRRRVEELRRQKETHRPQLGHQDSFDRPERPKPQRVEASRPERAQNCGGNPWSEGHLSSKSPRRSASQFDVEGATLGKQTSGSEHF